MYPTGQVVDAWYCTGTFAKVYSCSSTVGVDTGIGQLAAPNDELHAQLLQAVVAYLLVYVPTEQGEQTDDPTVEKLPGGQG